MRHLVVLHFTISQLPVDGPHGPPRDALAHRPVPELDGVTEVKDLILDIIDTDHRQMD